MHSSNMTCFGGLSVLALGRLARLAACMDCNRALNSLTEPDRAGQCPATAKQGPDG